MVRKYSRRSPERLAVPYIPPELVADAERAMVREEAMDLARTMRAQGRRVAFTGVMYEGTYAIGLAEENVPGFTPVVYRSKHGLMGTFSSYDLASNYADGMNEELGLTKVEAFRIVASSMRMR